MKKIIAVFEVEDDFSCKDYHASLQSDFGITHAYSELKELPQRKPIYYEVKTDEVERNIGYNKCLDEILEEEK